MNPIQSWDDLKDMLRRRRVMILGVFVLGCLFSVFVALQQQHLYQSSEVIQIAQPKIADDLAKSTAEGSSARRLQLIEQRLMARSSVLETIDKFGLYHELGDQPPSVLVPMLRRSVRIEGLAAAREGSSDDGTISILTITAEMPTAILAQRVAHELAQRTIELTVQSRIEQARETLAFFSEQEAQVISDIASLEDAVTEYRNANELSLTGTVEFRRDEIATINQGLLDIAREKIEIQRAAERAVETRRPATARRIQLESEEKLATLEEQRQLLLDRKYELESSIETTPQIERKLGEFERRQEQLREELDIIISNRTAAEIGFHLEATRQSERLTVLEPAPLPDYPITGSRKKLALMGGMASLMMALALAYLADFRSPVLRTSQQMQHETGLTPVVTIPILETGSKPRGFWGWLRRRSSKKQVNT